MEIELPHKYSPRGYQLGVWGHFVPNAEKRRGTVIAHRRWGKDKLAMNIAAVQSQARVGTYWHVLPYAKQARAVVWNGIDTKNEMRFLDHFPSKLISHKNENEMRIHFKNGSIWQAIGGDDIDRHVGTNPIGVVLSEWALLNPSVFDYIRPILRENDGWCLKITTVRGKNHAWKDAKLAEKLQESDPNWLYVNQTINDTDVISDSDIEEERASGMSESLIRQEYYNDPEIPIEGSYYINEINRARKDGRITSIPYDPKIPVDTYWDIGFSDFTVVVFVQEIGMERRIIDVYANSGETVGHYAGILRERYNGYGKHYGPWDLEIKQLAAGGKSVYDVARSQGIKFNVTPQPKNVMDGIEQVRNIFPSLWFDERKCERLIEALSSYRKEPLPDKLQSSADANEKAYKDTPLHDWTSHYADAMRIMAWHAKRRVVSDQPKQTKAEDSYAYI